jgi:protein-L-isoaspartate(D-aspartate) O-methyltransferase
MDFALARQNMVESQLRPNRVTAPLVVDAFRTVPRERFVPLQVRGKAYLDEHVQISDGRWLMPPMTLGRLIQEAWPLAEENAMVIGAGMGYSAAILGRLCQSVFAVETDPGLVSEMSTALTELALDNVVGIEAPLQEGYSKEAPYDIILMAGGVEEIPQALFDQLSEGGRLMAVVGAPGTIGRGTLFGKRHGVVSDRVLFDAAVKPLPGFERAPSFVF